MEVILDGSFMLNALKNKIDFLSQIEDLGLSPRVPKEVLDELKDSKVTSRFKNRALLSQLLDLIEQRKIKRVSLGKGKVDEALIKHGKKGIYIATMDSAIRRMIPNKLILSVAKKQISVERS